MQCKVQEHGANSRILAARLKNVLKNCVKLQNWRFSFSQFQSTVEIHWDLIIAGESVGSAVCFKNPWCQSLIFLGEALISCIVPGNHGLFSGQKKKKNPAQNAIPPLLHPHLCWMQHAGFWHSSRHTHRCEASWTEHHISLEPELPLHCNSVCLLLSFLFFIRRWVSVMKGSVLIQDEEITCWTPKDY